MIVRVVCLPVCPRDEALRIEILTRLPGIHSVLSVLDWIAILIRIRKCLAATAAIVFELLGVANVRALWIAIV